MLGGGNYRPVFFDPPRNVEQTKYHPARTYSHEIIVVAALSLAVIGGSQLSSAKFRNRCLYRLRQRMRRPFVLEEEAHRTIDRRS